MYILTTFFELSLSESFFIWILISLFPLLIYIFDWIWRHALNVSEHKADVNKKSLMCRHFEAGPFSEDCNIILLIISIIWISCNILLVLLYKYLPIFIPWLFSAFIGNSGGSIIPTMILMLIVIFASPGAFWLARQRERKKQKFLNKLANDTFNENK